ncbi:hypothetical protein BK025_05310 [Sodalis sp. TME1]|nr:hypothetical protein BK025_05310 [Sodalis sp. TME1]
MADFFDLLNIQSLSVIDAPGGNPFINGDIDLSGSDIAAIPPNLTIMGSLILRDCAKLSTLPTGLDIMDSLDLRNTPITALPSDIGVGRDMMLENTKLMTLPAGLAVEGALDLEGSLITSLPTNLYVDGYLNLRDTLITELPEDWSVEGPILLDTSRIRSPLTWRRVPLNALSPDDHIMQDYVLDTSVVDRFFWHQGQPENYVELFAIWVSGEIRVFAGRHVSSSGGFEHHNVSEIFRQAARECVTELEAMLQTLAERRGDA